MVCGYEVLSIEGRRDPSMAVKVSIRDTGPEERLETHYNNEEVNNLSWISFDVQDERIGNFRWWSDDDNHLRERLLRSQ